MKRFRFLAIALFWLPFLLPLPAGAASSEWVATPGGDVRLVALPAGADGTARAMLDIRLHSGWKTYWRDPGGSGIPPSLAVTGAELRAIGFPVPKHLGDETVRYVGYDTSVALPLSLAKASGGRLTVSVFLGVCKDICIPVQAELTTDTSGESFVNPLEEAAVAAAEASLPGEPSEDFRPLSARWSEDGKTLAVRLLAPGDGALPEVFVSGPSTFQFGAARAVSRDGEAFVAEVPVLHRPKKHDPAAGPIRLTARAGERTMESPLAID